jgi:hypothetical protein
MNSVLSTRIARQDSLSGHAVHIEHHYLHVLFEGLWKSSVRRSGARKVQAASKLEIFRYSNCNRFQKHHKSPKTLHMISTNMLLPNNGLVFLQACVAAGPLLVSVLDEKRIGFLW